jgi:hypothetical protein
VGHRLANLCSAGHPILPLECDLGSDSDIFQPEGIIILAVNGSPKPHGNLQRMLEKIVRDTGRAYEMAHLAKLKVNPGIGCVKCADTHPSPQSQHPSKGEGE